MPDFRPSAEVANGGGVRQTKTETSVSCLSYNLGDRRGRCRDSGRPGLHVTASDFAGRERPAARVRNLTIDTDGGTVVAVRFG